MGRVWGTIIPGQVRKTAGDPEPLPAQDRLNQGKGTIIARAGAGPKVVFAGDIHQIDTPYLDNQSNGLTVLIDRMKDQDLFAHVNLVKGERSPLAELASTLL